MSLEQTRFTLMALPQSIDAAGILSLNIVFIPRNINPLTDVNTIFGTANKAKPFVKVQPQFEIKIVNDPNEFPGKVAASEKVLDTISPFEYSAVAEEIYKTLRDAKDENGKAKYFDIDDTRSSDNPAVDAKHRAPKPALNRDNAIRKYLPLSYQSAFNFTSPRIKNAVTDDSYHCALRDQTPPVVFVKDDKVSWGKVYAHLMRQPLMAKKAGLIYSTKIKLEAGDLQKGGWIYVDIKNAADYFKEQNKSLTTPGADPFIKRYGAKIPVLKKNEARNIFAAVLFPVMKPGEAPTGIYDDLYIEAARFTEGFATIVHANQPVSGNILKEEQDGFHPQKESGIRLGWEDEQILIWYLRQMAVEENGTERLDAPLAVTGYQVDMKKSSAADNEWESLTAAKSNGSLQLEGIEIGEYTGELPYQVYPTKIYDGNFKSDNYWLPMYFANWNNTSIVLPDKTAAKIYQSEAENNTPVKVSETYLPVETKTKLLYGNEYDFRVRLSDISGGCPAPDTPTLPDFSVSHIGKTLFKRYVAPHAVIIKNEADIKSNTDDHNFSGNILNLSRPLLGYPAVVYTGRYTDVINKLAKSVQDLLAEQQASGGTSGAKAYGIPDPDVVSVEIKVEVETLQMDNLASENGREHYIVLYKTVRNFQTFDENNANEIINVPITFKDVNVLNLTNTAAPFPVATDNNFILQTGGEIILPTARNIRLTMRAVAEDKPNYWGHTNTFKADLDSRFGKTTIISMRKESANEKNIFTDADNPKLLQGIYLQPDPLKIKLDPVAFRTLQGGTEEVPDIVHRLSSQLDVAVKELTLTSENGERLQFWCSSMLRHSMAPDNSSITFANKNELQDHWLVCTTLFIQRDWSWDSLDASSFDIKRRRKFSADNIRLDSKPYEFIGDLELKKTASFQAIQEGKDGLIHREYTKIIFIDVVDVKPAEGDLPDTIELQYSIEPKFKTGHVPAADEAFETKLIVLPTTINPTQTPKLVAAGVALSPYLRSEKYASSEVRTRYLWLEFDKKPRDNHDSIFCRVLAYSPDQLISNNHPSLMEIPKELPLNLNPEYIRVVTPDSSHDRSGLEAMQKMEKSTDATRHFYLLPLPPGLHHESAELFGMFTYEFRYGHTDKIWSTAQGRFGRALRVAGLQHPAPSLNCLLNRDEKIISVNAPFATAVFNGRNVTASPPHTSIWALLYAQVKQADGLDYRNILLNEMELKPTRFKKEEEFRQELIQSLEAKNVIYKKKGIPIVQITPTLLKQNTAQIVALEKENTKQAYGSWKNTDIDEMLDLYGLPHDSSLSVLCVEVFGQITNIYEHMDNFQRNKTEFVEKSAMIFNNEVAVNLANTLKEVPQPSVQKTIDPLKSQLGLYRILRTSPLTEVPFICCTE
jgi:hypothetical protein